jgi:hypothetical protein
VYFSSARGGGCHVAGRSGSRLKAESYVTVIGLVWAMESVNGTALLNANGFGNGLLTMMRILTDCRFSL